MLIRKAILERIKSGEVTLAFRCWRRPTVKTGGTLKTAIGVLAIQQVEKTSVREVSEFEAKKAGYSGRDTLIKELGRRDGDVYRIRLAYGGEDPRIKLREDDNLSVEQFTEICERLQRLDSRSRTGKWTRIVLEAIQDHPMLPAARLATEIGFEKAWLKINIRKLKNLGLTVSQSAGYTLSPRGVAFLDRSKSDARQSGRSTRLQK